MAYDLYEDENDTYTFSIKQIGGSFSEIEVVDPTPDGGTYIERLNSYTVGRAVKTDRIPTALVIGGRKRKLRDYLSTIGGVAAVTDEFKAIVEELEPGAHQFLPVDLLWSDGSLAAKRYLLFVGKRLDTTDRERTTMKWTGKWWTTHTKSEREADPKISDKLVLNTIKIGGNHLWYDKCVDARIPFVSNTLGERLKASGMTGVGLRERPEA